MRIDKSIKAIPWPAEYHGGQQDFIVTLSWPVVDGERLLVATFVRNREKKCYGQPGQDFRLICSKKQPSAAILYRDARSPKRHGLREALRGFSAYPDSCYPEISERDEIALAKWLRRRGTNNHLMPELSAWVGEAMAAEIQRERDARGELRDEDVELCPEELPKGLVEYIRREVLPLDHVLLYKKGNVRGICYQCRQKVRAVPPQRFKQHEMTICPNCGARVHAILETSDSFKADYVEDIVTMQRGRDGATVFLRQWHLLRDGTAQWENIADHLQEVARYAVRGNRVAKWQHEEKINWYMNTTRNWLGGWTRVKNVTVVYDGQYYFYCPPDWKEQLTGTSLQYCDLQGYIVDTQTTKMNRNVVRFMFDWARYPAVEKLWKAGYTGLVHERIRGTWKRHQYAVVWSRDSIQGAIRFPGRLLKTCLPEQWTMDRMQKTIDAWLLAEAGVICEVEIAALVDMPAEIRCIRNALDHASVSKITRYINKNIDREREQRCRAEEKAKREGSAYLGSAPWETPGTYRDYLADCVTLGLDLDDKAVLFPLNLDDAHARTNAQVKHKVNKEEMELFRRQVEKIAMLAWEHNGLLIRPPESAEELTLEGKKLHHCVGGYVNRVAKGETMILFIRRIEDPSTPFYTLEWRDGSVIQCRTSHNKDYTRDERVASFVKAWVQHITKKGKRKQKAETAA